MFTEAVLDTVSVYVVADESTAVTTTRIVFAPTLSDKSPDVAPDVTVLPATVTVAPASVVVGVIVIVTMEFTTVAEYAVVPVASAGDSVPELRTNVLKELMAYADAVLVTAIE